MKYSQEQTLELARVALIETMQRIGSGYDWNDDPDGVTAKQGEALAAIDEQNEFLADLEADFAQTPEEADSEFVRSGIRQIISGDLLRRERLIALIERATGSNEGDLLDASPAAQEVDAYLAPLRPYLSMSPATEVAS